MDCSSCNGYGFWAICSRHPAEMICDCTGDVARRVVVCERCRGSGKVKTCKHCAGSGTCGECPQPVAEGIECAKPDCLMCSPCGGCKGSGTRPVGRSLIFPWGLTVGG